MTREKESERIRRIRESLFINLKGQDTLHTDLARCRVEAQGDANLGCFLPFLRSRDEDSGYR